VLLEEEILKGLRPKFSSHPPDSTWAKLSNLCMAANPKDRPSFSDVVMGLKIIQRAPKMTTSSNNNSIFGGNRNRSDSISSSASFSSFLE
jgi:hypothetical protein